MKTETIDTSVEAPEWSSVVKMTEGHDQHVHSVGIYNNGVEVARSYAVIEHTPDFIDQLVKQANESANLAAEVRAYRSALRSIADSHTFMGGTSVKELQAIARAAIPGPR